MFEVDINREFSAAHRLKGYKGNCASLHGHNWAVTVTVQSEKLDKIGIAVDFRKLKTELDAVLVKLDHSNLNDIHIVCSPNPTSECLAKFIFDRLS
ncbi:MAG: 6-carboxytetrahydropterin synthase QueD, partial [Victivallales bacterium]